MMTKKRKSIDSNSTPGFKDSLTGIADSLKRLGILYFRKARLQTTEKLTILLSTIAFTAVILALAVVFMVFVTIGVGHILAMSIAPHMAYLIVALFYLVLLVLAAVFRKQLFINPIARFLSRLLVEAPEEEDEEDMGDRPLRPQPGEYRKRKSHSSKEESTDSEQSLQKAKAHDAPAEDEYDEIARRIAMLIARENDTEEDIDIEIRDDNGEDLNAEIEDFFDDNDEKGGKK